ncbi:hypothetical protein V9T40_003417 [Parthenolecanium corni]|uniref:CCHC-type domain-containing protein n=1 Tax=Parthenolecanium corni TaxID=536013 RepID=A0AAN9TSQ0_9HEMI
MAPPRKGDSSDKSCDSSGDLIRLQLEMLLYSKELKRLSAESENQIKKAIFENHKAITLSSKPQKGSAETINLTHKLVLLQWHSTASEHENCPKNTNSKEPPESETVQDRDPSLANVICRGEAMLAENRGVDRRNMRRPLCTTCGKFSHQVRFCRYFGKVCYYCSQMGHISANCPLTGKERDPVPDMIHELQNPNKNHGFKESNAGVCIIDNIDQTFVSINVSEQSVYMAYGPRHYDGRFRKADETPKYRDGRRKKPTHYSDYDSEEDRKVSYTDRRDNIGATCQYYYDPPLYGLSPKEKVELFTVDIEKSREIVEKYKKKQVEIPEIVEIEDIDTLQIDDLKKKLKETIDVQKEYHNILNEYLTDDQSSRESDLKKMDEIVQKLSKYEQEVKNETPTHPKYYSETMNKYREGLPRGNKPLIRDSLESFSGNPKIAASTSLHKQDEVEDTGTDGIKEDKQTDGARQEIPERRNSRSKRYSPPAKRKEAEERRNERRSECREEYRRRSRDRDDDRNCYRDNRDRYRDERDRDRELDRRPYGREGHHNHRDSDPDDEDKKPSDQGRRNSRD